MSSETHQFSTNPAFQKFADWILTNDGYIHPSLTFTPPDSLVGSVIITTESLPPSTKLLTCPRTLAIDYAKVKAQYSPEFIDYVPPHGALCAFIVGELLKGEESFWAPYFNILPRTFDTPLYYDKEDLRWLAGCNLDEGQVELRREAWKDEWVRAVEGLRREKNVGLSAARKYSWELFLRAATILTSRSFPDKLMDWTADTSIAEIADDVDSLPALFPLIDSANHQPFTKITWARGDSAVDVVSGDEIPAGGEVCNNYGPKGNEELLMGYGFTLPDNPFDTMTIKFHPTLPPTHAPLLSQLQASPHPPGIYYLTPRNQNGTSVYPPALLGLFHLLTTTPRELLIIAANPTKPPYTLRNVLAAHHHLLLAISPRIPRFPEESTLPPCTTPRRKAAKIYRDSQIAIMNAAIAESSAVIRTILDNHPDTAVTLTSLLTDPVYAAAVLPVFGSTDPHELRMAGQDDLVFTLYVCWRYLHRDSGPAHWKAWFERIGGPVEGMDGEEEEEELVEVAELFAALFPAAAGAAPEVFGGEGWTEGLLRWGMTLFGEESIGVGIPGEEGERVVLCVE